MCDRKEVDRFESEPTDTHQTVEDEVAMAVARAILEKYRIAFEELAK